MKSKNILIMVLSFFIAIGAFLLLKQLLFGMASFAFEIMKYSFYFIIVLVLMFPIYVILKKKFFRS